MMGYQRATNKGSPSEVHNETIENNGNSLSPQFCHPNYISQSERGNDFLWKRDNYQT